MKNSAKALIIIFLAVALILYGIIYLIPKIQGLSMKTTLLEYGDLPVEDEEEICFVRAETLYLTGNGGEVTKLVKEGTKVRQGIKIVDVKYASESGSGQTDSSDEQNDGDGDDSSSDEYDDIIKNIGDSAVTTIDNEAGFSAVVSYYADGFESKITPGAIDGLTRKDAGALPDEAVPLDRADVRDGDPVFKLTDNNLWYMVFWLKGGSQTGEIVKYEEGKAVTVDFGSTKVDATIEKLVQQGSDWKIVLRSDVYYKDLPKYRKKTAKVITDEIRGLSIDAKSIVVRDGIPGVFVKQLSGGFKWVPVEIRKYIGEQRTVTVGSFKNEDGEVMSTVNYYDEILTDPEADGYE